MDVGSPSIPSATGLLNPHRMASLAATQDSNNPCHLAGQRPWKFWAMDFAPSVRSRLKRPDMVLGGPAISPQTLTERQQRVETGHVPVAAVYCLMNDRR
jgi:hypothetical protein